MRDRPRACASGRPPDRPAPRRRRLEASFGAPTRELGSRLRAGRDACREARNASALLVGSARAIVEQLLQREEAHLEELVARDRDQEGEAHAQRDVGERREAVRARQAVELLEQAALLESESDESMEDVEPV